VFQIAQTTSPKNYAAVGANNSAFTKEKMQDLLSVYETQPQQFIARKPLAGMKITNVEEMLKLVYVGTDTKNLKKAIDFVQFFDSSHQAQAYSTLYEDVKLKKHTTEPEMLLLQKKIRQLVVQGADLQELTIQVDADCQKIISRILKGIKEKDYSISDYVAKKLDYALLNENMATIVQEFSTGSLENTLLLIEYSIKLPFISNRCYLIDALLKELEKRQLLTENQPCCDVLRPCCVFC
jgi:hypothetical protein